MFDICDYQTEEHTIDTLIDALEVISPLLRDILITMAKDQPAGAQAVNVDYAAIVASWSPEERASREKAFLRKIDFRLLPILVGPDAQNEQR